MSISFDRPALRKNHNVGKNDISESKTRGSLFLRAFERRVFEKNSFGGKKDDWWVYRLEMENVEGWKKVSAAGFI